MFQALFFLYFDWEMMTYWAIVGLSHAIDFHNEAQERKLTTAQLQTRLAEAADAMLAQLSDLLRLTLERVGTRLTLSRLYKDKLQQRLGKGV